MHLVLPLLFLPFSPVRIGEHFTPAERIGAQRTAVSLCVHCSAGERSPTEDRTSPPLRARGLCALLLGTESACPGGGRGPGVAPLPERLQRPARPREGSPARARPQRHPLTGPPSLHGWALGRPAALAWRKAMLLPQRREPHLSLCPMPQPWRHPVRPLGPSLPPCAPEHQGPRHGLLIPGLLGENK